MIITYDRWKSQRNVLERGLWFDLAADFDFASAIYALDERRNYSEDRVRAIGRIHSRIYVLVYTTTSAGIRVISLRRANAREKRRYEAQTYRQS